MKTPIPHEVLRLCESQDYGEIEPNNDSEVHKANIAKQSLEIADTSRNSLPNEVGSPNSNSKAKQRRKTDHKESDTESVWKAFLLKHHKYNNPEDEGLNQEPTSPKKIEDAKVGCSKSMASRHFNTYFGNHKAYERTCTDNRELKVELAMLAGDLTTTRIQSFVDKQNSDD